MHDDPHAPLRREVDQLGRAFGEVIQRLAGATGYERVESVRMLARQLPSSTNAIKPSAPVAGSGIAALPADGPWPY